MSLFNQFSTRSVTLMRLPQTGALSCSPVSGWRRAGGISFDSETTNHQISGFEMTVWWIGSLTMVFKCASQGFSHRKQGSFFLVYIAHSASLVLESHSRRLAVWKKCWPYQFCLPTSCQKLWAETLEVMIFCIDVSFCLFHSQGTLIYNAWGLSQLDTFIFDIFIR